ncbi:hypothetical protein [Taibaiella chishuiensis]|uniref:DUF3311 domain-containing protein n=1 Tax=Taibaiella chishuiensis TaxID=1434707 RepID=A0A2P8DAM6_9BACT|nr:hypothetical protein [Taibaiella chishuiensis]PSK94259.1 hypothetical protein B0I18_101414 [Taibaiella chishuiensis]
MNPAKSIRFLLIALLMLVLFTYPLLSTANKRVMVGGLPLLYVYIGVVWVLAILVLYFTVNPLKRK